MFSGALQSQLLQLTHLFSPPWSPCLPSHLEGVLLCVSRGLLQCQEQNPSFLELQPHRCSSIPVGTCWDSALGAGASSVATTRGWQEPLCLGCPKTTSPGSWAFRSTAGLKGCVCASCSTLFFLLKEWAKATFSLHQVFLPQYVLSVYLLPCEVWSSETWAAAARVSTVHTKCCCRWGRQCYFLVGSRRKRASCSWCIPGFHQVLCLRLMWISDVQDGAPDSCYSSQYLRATERRCCTVTLSLVFLHFLGWRNGLLPPLLWKSCTISATP